MYEVLKTITGQYSTATDRLYLPPFGIIFLWACLVFAVFWPSSQTMFTIWVHSAAYHQGMLVLPISLLLISRTRSEPTPISINQSRFGLYGIGAFCTLWVIGRFLSANILEHISLVGIIISGVVAMFGVAHSKRWLFPLGFMFFMVPAGAVLLPLLQLITAEIVTSALNITGIETIRNGTVLSTSAARFDISTGCAGLNFIIASLMVSALVSYLAFQTIKKMMAYVFFAIFISIAVNWLRAYLIIAIATMSDMKIGIAENHVMLGWVLYCIVIVGLIWVAKKFSDPVQRDTTAKPARGRQFSPPYATLILMLVTLAVSLIADGFINKPDIANTLNASDHLAEKPPRSLTVGEL